MRTAAEPAYVRIGNEDVARAFLHEGEEDAVQAFVAGVRYATVEIAAQLIEQGQPVYMNEAPELSPPPASPLRRIVGRVAALVTQ